MLVIWFRPQWSLLWKNWGYKSDIRMLTWMRNHLRPKRGWKLTPMPMCFEKLKQSRESNSPRSSASPSSVRNESTTSKLHRQHWIWASRPYHPEYSRKIGANNLRACRAAWRLCGSPKAKRQPRSQLGHGIASSPVKTRRSTNSLRVITSDLNAEAYKLHTLGPISFKHPELVIMILRVSPLSAKTSTRYLFKQDRYVNHTATNRILKAPATILFSKGADSIIPSVKSFPPRCPLKATTVFLKEIFQQ